MTGNVYRVFVEKRSGFNVQAKALMNDLKDTLRIDGIDSVRIINRYDVQGISQAEYEEAVKSIFSEAPADIVSNESISFNDDEKVFAVEFLPGQYDQTADSATQCIQILTGGERPAVRTAKLIVIKGCIADSDFDSIKSYCINPVESREASFDRPESLYINVSLPDSVKTLDGFISKTDDELADMCQEMGYAMLPEDLAFCRNYFRDTEKRDPTVTEIKVIDTYWSDHCRHTTFLTKLNKIEIEDSIYTKKTDEAYKLYLEGRKFLDAEKKGKDICLMDIALAAMKEFRKRGDLDDLEVSDEINACSIVVDVDVNGIEEEWLVMFKNETHNHPTEIEPFGGAATCLGGAIRDPLSGRSYVYQAMRVTGCGDPRVPVSETLPGKLPQKKLTNKAAEGYSSYGNQIGLATGQVHEIYHDGYVAKRMEIGAVIGASPRRNVVRIKPEPGDIIVLVGGRTGRDGCGGATGSSKEHTEESILTCSAEVQKGNPVTERKIQRLFRKPEVSLMIKKCNDFGAGGVSVAIGELADGLLINLDAVPKKYEGLDGTELAISESQERMAVVLDSGTVQDFIKQAKLENLEVSVVAIVTDDARLKMMWKSKIIVDIARDFLDTNGVVQNADVYVKAPANRKWYENEDSPSLEQMWIDNLSKLDTCSQKGLVERFDSSIGANTVLMPYGGKYQLSTQEGMAAKIPVLGGETNTATVMSFGFNPNISSWSPFHGAVYAVIEACTKIACMGGDPATTRLTLQEYFEKLGKDPVKWGKPFAALLGAYYAQSRLGMPAIGGKDSMSGTFKDMDVPPTLVAFAVSTADARKVVSSEFKRKDSEVVYIKTNMNEDGLPDFDELRNIYDVVKDLISTGKVLSARSIRSGGVAEAVSGMCFGNKIGFVLNEEFDEKYLFTPDYGSIILEVEKGLLDYSYLSVYASLLGETTNDDFIKINDVKIELNKALDVWTKVLEKVFPTKTSSQNDNKVLFPADNNKAKHVYSKTKIVKPTVFIPVFPGTNCEYDTAKAFEIAGAKADVRVFRNMTVNDIEQSIASIVEAIDKSQIIALPGGFSAGDEPDGSGKFIAGVFRNPYIKDAVTRLLEQRDGLMLGICNGFQALIKLGLVPYGRISDLEQNSPTLTFNSLSRHVSCMVNTKVSSTLSPWLALSSYGDVSTVPVSHGEGRFVASEEEIQKLMDSGQVATLYVDDNDNPTLDIRYNPNGSMYAIESITSPDGRIFGKMAHSERKGINVAKNVPGDKESTIFKAGVKYFD